MHPLKGKVVVVTGGSSGIGRATALRCAAHGAKIVLGGRNRERLDAAVAEATALGAEALAIPVDVTSAEQCRQLIEASVERFGGIDVLLCSAGQSMRAFLAGSRLEALERVMHVNFFGTLYPTYYAIPHLKRTRGSLVAISSLTGKRGIPSYAIYGASKFAIQGLYESLRLELSHDGVHVGIVSPGFVDTPLRDRVLGADGEPWAQPPPPPFRVRPLERCVDKIVKLIVKRRAEVLIPWLAGPLLTLDRTILGWLGDRLLKRRFPPG